jgi:hypothetical protein
VENASNRSFATLGPIPFIGMDMADMLVKEILSATCATGTLWRVTQASPARPTRATANAAREELQGAMNVAFESGIALAQPFHALMIFAIP